MVILTSNESVSDFDGMIICVSSTGVAMLTGQRCDRRIPVTQSSLAIYDRSERLLCRFLVPVRLSIPTLNRLVPKHMIHGTLALTFQPLFGKPKGGDQDSQHDASTNGIEKCFANRQPRCICCPSAERTAFIQLPLLGVDRNRRFLPPRRGKPLGDVRLRTPTLHSSKVEAWS